MKQLVIFIVLLILLVFAGWYAWRGWKYYHPSPTPGFQQMRQSQPAQPPNATPAPSRPGMQ